jgi:SAM-dependent methyltransferase
VRHVNSNAIWWAALVNKDLLSIICCPRCRASISGHGRGAEIQLRCSNEQCAFSKESFLSLKGQPVLIDFDASVLTKDGFVVAAGESPIPRKAPQWRRRIDRALFGVNKTALGQSQRFLEEAKKLSGGARPRILVVGGGTIGNGADALYSNASIDLLGTDIYVSEHTQIIADGHQLPFVSESFHGIWTQAVLEHVLEPSQVVSEIHRVLKPSGLVYAEIPFMQQVHEGAYDFTRFTQGGMRWLFRKFSLVDSGTVAGAGTALTWSARYLARSLTGSNKFATAVGMALSWMRFFDRKDNRDDADAASCLFFLGAKSDQALRPREIVSYYYSRK